MSKADNEFFRDIVKRLVPFADGEREIDGEGNEKLIIHDLRNRLGGLGIHPDDVIPKMKEKGLIEIKDKSPDSESYYLFPNAKGPRVKLDVSTDTLRRIAQRLAKNAPVKPGQNLFQGEMACLELEAIQKLLSRWHHDPDLLIPLLKAKYYLVKKPDSEEAFYIAKSQEEGQAIKQKLAA